MQIRTSFRRYATRASVLFVASVVMTTALAQPHSYPPPGGMIPNEIVAREVAKVYLVAVYGKAQIESEFPLVVSLKDKVWTVQGSFNRKHSAGGVAEIDLAQQDGRVLRLTHSM